MSGQPIAVTATRLRFTLEDPNLFTVYDDAVPGRRVLMVGTGDMEVEIVATLDALAIAAHNILAIVTEERAG